MKIVLAIMLAALVLHAPLALSEDDFVIADTGDYPLDVICWKDVSSRRRECLKVKMPSRECVFQLAAYWHSTDDFDLDGDGVLSVNDFGLLISDLQRESESVCR